jgi:hypothetical protein
MRLPCLFSFGVLALVVGCAQSTGSTDPQGDTSATTPGASQTADGNKTCTTGVCTSGGDLTFCITTAPDGACAKAEYTHAGETYTCAACDDCTAAAQQATESCGTGSSSSGGSSSGSSGSSSGGSSSGGSSSGSSGGGPTVNCTPINTACVGSGQMSYCVTTTNSACTDITYKYGSESYSCGGCSSCTDAYYQAYTSCQDAVGACDDLANCCATIDSAYKSSCNSSLSSYQGQAYGDVSCKSLLQSYHSSNLCP